MSINKISYLYISLTVILWGSTAAIAKLLLRTLDNLQILLYISFVAATSLFIIAILQKKLDIIKNYSFRDYWHFAYMGFIGIFLYHVFLFSGLTYAPAHEAFIVNYTWPIWVVIFAVLILKEKMTYNKILAIILGFVGVYIVIAKGDFFSFSSINLRGDMFALAGAISYGLFSVIGKKNNRDIVTSMMFYYGFSFVYCLIATPIFSSIPILTSYETSGIIWLGVFAGGLPFVFWFIALRHGDTVEMSNIVFLTPFISLIYIYLLIGEEILLTSIIGLILIVIGIYLHNNRRRKKNNSSF
jgi:drug/metabolite transporter (DMT)-like permease